MTRAVGTGAGRGLARGAIVLLTIAALLPTSCAMRTSHSAAGPLSGAAQAGSLASTPSASQVPDQPAGSTSSAGTALRPPLGLSPMAARARPLVYVPNSMSNTVDVIDPARYRVIAHFHVGAEPQHVVPAWDLRTLWVNDDRGNSLVPINPDTGRPGRPVPVADPYNLYFTPDGAHALVMAERERRIDVRDPHTMRLQRSIPVPCRGVNHADFTLDGSWFLASCEFSGRLLVVAGDLSRVIGVIDLNAIKTPGATSPAHARMMSGPASNLDPGASSMPQDVRLAPDGRTFLVADMLRNGVWLVDAATRRVRGFEHTGRGAHGIYPSRDFTRIFVSDRDAGLISVLDGRSLKVIATWRLPGGGSPDMGGLSLDGSQLWLSGRYDDAVYVISTADGRLLHRIPVGRGPHGLCVWPQPGRYSLGHTGNMR